MFLFREVLVLSIAGNANLYSDISVLESESGIFPGFLGRSSSFAIYLYIYLYICVCMLTL